MAEFTGTISPGDINTVYSRTAIALGTEIEDQEGNRYKFLRGVGSTIAGSWVTYDETFDTTLLASGAKGPVAVAQAIIDSTGEYGWYCVYGTTTAASKPATADNSLVGQSATSGFVGDGFASGDAVLNAICRSAHEEDSSNSTTLYQIIWPWIGRSAWSN